VDYWIIIDVVSLASKQYKIVLLGDGAVGKTSLRRSFMGEQFKENYHMTLGSDFATKTFSLGETEIKLIIWDLAGQPRFSTVRSFYYKGAKGALLVYDVTRADSYESLANWVAELLKNNGGNKVPIVLIANKIDLREKNLFTIQKEFGLEYAKKLSEWSGFTIPYIETSAKTGENVNKAFHILIDQILESSKSTIIQQYLDEKE